MRFRTLALSAAVVALVAAAGIAGVYEDAVKLYRAGRFAAAAELLEKKPQKQAGDYALLGWSYLQAGRLDEARRNFRQAITLRPDLADAQCGLGYTFLRAGDPDQANYAFSMGLEADRKNVDCLVGRGTALRQKGETQAAIEAFDKALDLDPSNATAKQERQRLQTSAHRASAADRISEAIAIYRRDELNQAAVLLRQLAAEDPANADVQLALGDTLTRLGDNLSAAKIYRSLIEQNVAVDEATARFVDMYGVAQYDAKLPLAPVARPRPAAMQLGYRTAGDYFEYFDGKAWKKTYLMGANIGPARPGEFASTPPRDVKTYLTWFSQLAAMNSNMVRVYTILPPAFYTALRIHNERAMKPLWLLHEVWLDERDEKNLYGASWSGEFEREIRYVVDLIHGNAVIPFRRGHAWGVYTTDVSKWTFAIGPGREVEPSIVLVTNRSNPALTRFDGEYVRVANGSPTEVWFAKMMELTARYEMERYNAQRPLTIINWPPLDPMTHVTEANYAEELQQRKKRGENILEKAPDLLDDADIVSVDVMKLDATPKFPAGLFASFHVYTYWPDFLMYDQEYPKVRDAQGSNRYYGYLLDLKNHTPNRPLLIAEYGVPTSWGVAHIHPDGWHNGGFSEKAQADLLVRMTKNIRDSKSAGGLVFAWQDEWWKCVADVATNPFDVPNDRRPYWENMLNPEEHFGILGYNVKGTVPLLRGVADDWKRATLLLEDTSGRTKPGDVRRMFALADPAYLYLRLDVEKGTGANAIDWDRADYWIALNTLPGKAGSRELPGIGLAVDTAANFLIQMKSAKDAKVLVAMNYNPNEFLLNRFVAGGKRGWNRRGMTIGVQEKVPFEEIVVEANQPRWGRDGSVFPPLFFNRSPLVRGKAAENSKSGWNVDEANGMIELRIPWGMLYVTDPSRKNVMNGTDGNGRATWTETQSIAVSAIVVAPNGTTVVSSLPAISNGRLLDPYIPRFTWSKWDRVDYEPYLKESYGALKKTFGDIARDFQ